MIELEQRAAVIAEALTWIGTPWRHAANVKGEAVDCAMLLREAFVRTGVLEPFDPRPYPRTWFLHQEEERFIGWIESLGAKEIEVAAARPADVLVYLIGKCYAHGTLLVQPQVVVHAYYKNQRCVLTETFDSELAAKKVRAFDFWAGRREP